VVVIALAIAGGVLLLRKAPPETPVVPEVTPQPIPTVEIVVAANNLNRGTELTEGLVGPSFWKEDNLPPFYNEGIYFSNMEEVYGLKLLTFVPQGMPLMRSMLTSETPEMEGGSPLTPLIPPGKRAMVVLLDQMSAVNWFIQPGDHVDVLASWNVVNLDQDFQSALPNDWVVLQCPEGYTCQGAMGRMEMLPNGMAVMVYPTGPGMSGYVAQLTIQDAVVLRIGNAEPVEPTVLLGAAPTATPDPAAPPAEVIPTPTPAILAAQPVILLLNVQDALVLKGLIEQQANVDLILRGAEDRAAVDTEAVTLDYILNTYGIEAPPQLTIGVIAPTADSLQQALMQKALQDIQTGGQPQPSE
jgi:pilus assembly protein CpaB